MRIYMSNEVDPRTNEWVILLLHAHIFCYQGSVPPLSFAILVRAGEL